MQQDESQRNILSEANRLKVESGLALRELIADLLKQLEELEIIKGFESNVNFPHKGCSYSKQYKADYIIETNDLKMIVVRTSSSFRQDRIKTSFYDLEGISKNGERSNDVVASIFVTGDKYSADFESHRNMFEKKEYYCPATHLFYVDEFIEFLNEYKLNIEIEKEEESEIQHAEASSVTGSNFGKAGNKLEHIISDLLSEEQQLNFLKTNDSSSHPVFKSVIEALCVHESIELQNILSIEGSNRVTLLKSGGNPKTDVILSISLNNGSNLSVTLSIKNTKKSKVSCHDYTAEAFIRVLDCKDTRLSKYLELFQEYPTYSAFEENIPQGYSIEEFAGLLNEKEPVFSEWVTMGKHDGLNLIDPEIQVSKYLFINNPETKEHAFYLYEEYIDIINQQRDEKFGVPFSWTYPSKKRGERIQLKLPIILD